MVLRLIIIMMYIYHVPINAPSAHMIHINLNIIFCTHVEHSPTKTIYIKCYTEKQTSTRTTNTRTHTHTQWQLVNGNNKASSQSLTSHQLHRKKHSHNTHRVKILFHQFKTQVAKSQVCLIHCYIYLFLNPSTYQCTVTFNSIQKTLLSITIITIKRKFF